MSELDIDREVRAIIDPARQSDSGDGTMVVFGFETLYERVRATVDALRSQLAELRSELDTTDILLSGVRSELQVRTNELAAANAERDSLKAIERLAIHMCEARAEGLPIERRLDKLHEALVRQTLATTPPEDNPL
jgi:chromosome segregation ATPase